MYHDQGHVRLISELRLRGYASQISGFEIRNEIHFVLRSLDDLHVTIRHPPMEKECLTPLTRKLPTNPHSPGLNKQFWPYSPFAAI